MKPRMSALPGASRFRCFTHATLAGLTGFLVGSNPITASSAASKVSGWASVVPAPEEFRNLLPLETVQAVTAKRAAALALYYKARRLELEDDDASALAIYLQAAALNPSCATLSQRIIGIYTRTGRLNEAMALLEKTVAQFPKDPGALLSLARFLDQYHDGAPELKLRALRTAESAVAKFPGSPDAIDHLVRLHLADQHREKAQVVIEAALRSPSLDPDYWLNLVTPTRNAFPLDDRSTYEKNFALVSTGIEKALALAPADPDVQEAAGDFFARNQQPARALALYEKAAAARPGDLKTRQKLGQLLRMADRNLEAITLFESLVHIDAGDVVSHKALVSLYQKTDPARSLTHRAELLRLESGDPRDYATTTSELLDAKRPTEALTLVKRGIFFNPKSAQLVYLLARVLSEKGDHPAALDSLAEAETIAKEHAPKLLDSAFYYSWGAAAARARHFEQAETHYRQSIEKAPVKEPQCAAPAYNDLGFLWLSQNKNLEAAGELLRTANGLVKDNPAYLDSLGWYYFLKKDYPNALKTLRRAVALAKSNPPADLLDHLDQAETAAAAAKP